MNEVVQSVVILKRLKMQSHIMEFQSLTRQYQRMSFNDVDRLLYLKLVL